MDNTLIIKGDELKKIITSSFPNVEHLITTDRDYALLDTGWVKEHTPTQPSSNGFRFSASKEK